MKDSTLLWCALVVSLTGVVLLFFLSQSHEIGQVSIDQAKLLEDYEEVYVEGTITAVHKTGNITIIRMTQLQEIKAVVFSDVNISEGSLIQVYGQVKEYKGEKEITADRIRVVG